MSSSNLVSVRYKKEATYGVPDPAATASLELQDLTYTAVEAGEGGNEVSIEYVGGATAGDEIVTVTGKAIVVQIEDGVSTADDILDAIEASDDASDLVTVAVTGTGGDAQFDISTAAEAILNLTADVTLTSVAQGSNRNTKTFTLQVLAAAANPTNKVLVAITGTAAAIICTVTPNNGTNNTGTPVDLTSAELVTLINDGSLTKVNLTDAGSRLQLQTAAGGDATALADGGEGDGVVGTFSGGLDDAATPLAGGLNQFQTVRFTSEKYSGTPETTESQQIRQDRMSSGQVVTGLKVGGGHSFELAVEKAMEDYFESAMCNPWETGSPTVGRSMALDASAKTITCVTGDFEDEGLVVGDVIVLSAFADDGNNVPVMLTSVTALVLNFAGPSGMTTVTEAAEYTRADKLTIGTVKKSLTVEKEFTDLTNKGIVYKGMMVGQMDMDIQYGSLVSGTFELMGNDYDPVAAAADFPSFGESIAQAATTQSLNGSVDMPFLTTDVSGSYVQDGMCIQSLKISLSNNLTAQTCIGRASPENYNQGTAQIKIDLSSYLKDTTWNMLAKKLSQEPFAIGFLVKNLDGWYGFYLPAIQVSFEDPASGGANQDISMEMTGQAKVGANGESALSIYRLPV